MTELETIEQRIEAAIKVGKNAFVAAWLHVVEVGEKELWKDKYTSFSDYCNRRWKISRQRGFQLVEYVEIIHALPEKCQKFLTHESQIRALKSIPKDKREEVIEKAKSSGKITAKSIEKAAKSDIACDETGYAIPDGILEDWIRAEELGNKLLRLISELRVQIKEGFESEDVIFREVSKSITADLNNAYTSIKGIIPHSICTTCQGHGRSKCSLCKGRGFISQFAYEHWIPQETKNLRKSV